MEKKDIYFNSDKAMLHIALGVAAAIIILALLGLSVLGVFALIIAISYIFFASKSLSKKPQLTFSEEGLYVGFKVERLTPWRSIESIVLRKIKVDYRSINHIEITSRVKSNGPSNKLIRRFPVENLKISAEELEKLINLFMQQSSKKQEEVK
jgi:hypothetical protein